MFGDVVEPSFFQRPPQPRRGRFRGGEPFGAVPLGLGGADLLAVCGLAAVVAAVLSRTPDTRKSATESRLVNRGETPAVVKILAGEVTSGGASAFTSCPADEPDGQSRREVTARGHPGSPAADMPVVREGQPRHQGRRVPVGVAGEPKCRCPAPGVLLPGGLAVASDIAAAGAAPTCFPRPGRAEGPAAGAARRAVSGSCRCYQRQWRMWISSRSTMPSADRWCAS